MTETVDQGQAQPPRALAGVIEDATSLSFVPASHFGGSRRWPPCLTAMPYSGKAVTSGSAIPYTTSVDVNLRMTARPRTMSPRRHPSGEYLNGLLMPRGARTGGQAGSTS